MIDLIYKSNFYGTIYHRSVKILLEIPKIHKDVISIGAGNFYPLKKAYSEVIRIRNFDHFSINIETATGRQHYD